MSRSLSSSQLSDPITSLLGSPSLWQDEDPDQFDELMAALTAEFSPATAYERILVRNISELQWDMLRHRRLQKTLLRRQIAKVAALILQGPPDMPFDLGLVSPEYEAMGRALVGPDPAARQKTEVRIEAAGHGIDEIVSEAYQQVAGEIARHEQRLAALIEERRGLREELEMLQKRRRPMPPEAELAAE